MTPEQKTRLKTDQLINQAGWEIKDIKNINLGSSFGIANRYTLNTGLADYMIL
jgi:hypothetical protein